MLGYSTQTTWNPAKHDNVVAATPDIAWYRINKRLRWHIDYVDLNANWVVVVSNQAQRYLTFTI